MNTSRKPLDGPGRLQWNAGGWFGSSLGSSAWMIVASCFLLFHGQLALAMVPAIGFSIVVIASMLLWSRCDRIRPFTAMMALLGLLAIVVPFVLFFVQWFGSPSARAAMNWPESPWPTILVIAIVPALMIWLVVLEQLATKSKDKTVASP